MFRALFRFIKTLFGLAEGGTERATDALLTSSPDAIRAQFRKTHEDKVRDYEEMKKAVSELMGIRENRARELRKIGEKYAQLSGNMQLAIANFKSTQDERCKTIYTTLAEERDGLGKRIEELQAEVAEEDARITAYMEKLKAFEQEIRDLKREEAETVADIVSSQKIADLNKRLAGFASDTQAKNLEAVREARQKALMGRKVTAQLEAPSQGEALNQAILVNAQQNKYLAEFEEQTKMDVLFAAEEKEVKKVVNPVLPDKIDTLFTE